MWIMMIMFVFIAIGLLFGYLIFHLRKADFWKKTKLSSTKIILLNIFILLLITIILTKISFGNMILFLFFTYAYLITDIAHFIIKKIKPKKKIEKSWRFVYNNSILAILLFGIMTISGYFTAIDVQYVSYTIETSKIMNRDYRVVLLSDLHLGTTMNSKKLESYVDEISAKNPDFVILAGDIFDEGTTDEEIVRASAVLGRIKTQLGIYYIYGNHEREHRKSKIYEELNRNSISVLEDEIYQIDNIYLIGRKDVSFTKTSPRATLEELTENLNETNFVFLLDHQPVDLKKAEENGVDLQVSGHTHNGQIWPLGPVAELIGINEMAYGIREINDYTIIVSSGIGAWGAPFRLGSQSEIVEITIKGNNNA